jgi:hypothetical protein
MSTKFNLMFPALALVGLLAIPLSAAGDEDTNTQVALLHELHAAFHAATSVHDPLNGDSPAAIDQRVRDVMSLWTDNGLWLFSVGSPFDGYYLGKGDPADPATCPDPSGNPANQGTMCSLVKYVLPPFQPGNKIVSLAPAYKSRFDPHGQMATIYFECHLFNVDLSTGNPPWTQVGHIAVNAVATKVNGQWRFSQIIATPAPVPIP